MSRKLLLDPYLAIHGKIMAKNGHFFMEFWPIFDIFHGLRPYLCSKAQDLGFHKQPTHRRRGDEPFFLLWGRPFMTGDGPKMAKQGRLVNAPKWSKRVSLHCLWQNIQREKAENVFLVTLNMERVHAVITTTTKSNFSAHKKIVHEKTKFSIEQITWD